MRLLTTESISRSLLSAVAYQSKVQPVSGSLVIEFELKLNSMRQTIGAQR